jgi:uncharacterized protein YbbC (DUF1343 family)
MTALYPDSGVFSGSKERNAMFDKVMGTDAVRTALERGTPVTAIVESWKRPMDDFMVKRKKYLLYQ